MTLNKENIAAITAEIFTHPNYKELYDKFCDNVSGTPGFWAFAVEAADVFTKLEDDEQIEWDGEYMEAVESFAHKLITGALANGFMPTHTEMVTAATSVLEDVNEDKKFAELDEVDATATCVTCGKPLEGTSWFELSPDRFQHEACKDAEPQPSTTPEFTVRINLHEHITMGDVIAALKRATNQLEQLADATDIIDRNAQESWGCAVIRLDSVKPGLTGEMLIVE